MTANGFGKLVGLMEVDQILGLDLGLVWLVGYMLKGTENIMAGLNKSN
ncbi:MAG: hypothetical protein ACREBU_11485 [Nitrososphaera sp.]